MFELEDIKTNCLNWFKKIRNFLLEKDGKEFLIFLFFFLIASVFWLFQTLNKEYEAELLLPVYAKEPAENMVLTSDSDFELRVIAKDKGTVLLSYLFAKKFSPIVLDFTGNNPKNGQIKVITSGLKKDIQNQFNISTQLLSVKPDTLEYIYAPGNSKRIPVELSGRVTAGRQYYLTDTIFSPDSVWVYAPADILDTITRVYTQPIELRNISDTVKISSPLSSAKGVKFVPNSVEITIPSDIYTEKTVEIPIHGTGFPHNKLLRTFPSKVHVTFQIGSKSFREINAGDFHIEVTYNELLKHNTDKYAVKLGKIPSVVNQIIRIVPEQIDFLIEKIPLDGH